MQSLPPQRNPTESGRKAPLQLDKPWNRLFARLLGDLRGQGVVEYALMLALIAFGAVAAERAFACQVECGFENAANQLEHILAKGKKIPPGQAKKCSKKCD